MTQTFALYIETLPGELYPTPKILYCRTFVLLTHLKFFVQFQILIFSPVFKAHLTASIGKIITILNKMLQRMKLHIDTEKS
jgi:hypothetical protein